MDTVLGVGQMQVPSQPLGQQGSPSDGESSAFALVHVAPRGCCGAAGHRVRDSTHAPPPPPPRMTCFPSPAGPTAGRLLSPERRGVLSCLRQWSSLSGTLWLPCFLGCFVSNGSLVLFC